MRILPLAAACLAVLAPAARAQSTASPPDAGLLDRVQVTATRTPRVLARTPASITVLDAARLQTDTAGLSLAEHLAGVPGVLARSRQNYAQDEQVSIRGFGTRASFGIRSVRVFVDGLPATLPDGQGQVSNLPLAGLERIEVLRGPSAALYGNGAGGVLQAFTADGGEPGHLGGEFVRSGFDTWRLSTASTGALGRWDYSTSSTYLRTAGYREHSRARRDVLHAKATREVGAGRLTLVLNALDAPDAQDPQGLAREQVETDPRQASAAALAFGTRKSARQWQLGAIYERDAGAGALRLLGYAGERRVEQVLGVPIAAQRSPLSAGGWIDLASPLAGLDARASWRARVAGRPIEIVAGVAAEAQRQARRGYENFIGATPGVRGALRQDQDDRVHTIDPYAHVHWDVAPDWTLSAGVRHSRVDFRSDDRYVTAGNPDDSGRLRFRGTSPVLGATWRPDPRLALHAAVGRGFETPTFIELAYRDDGGSGPNVRLQPMRTRSAELGLRFDTGRWSGEASLFRADTRDELAVSTSSGGRTAYRSVGRARRAGVEGAVSVGIADRWRARLGGTWLEATYRDAFACSGPGCEARPVLPAGTRIPGVPRMQAAAALRWGGELGWYAQGESRYVGGVTANVAGSDSAAGYTVFDASAGYGFRRGRADGRLHVGVANLADEAHVGSVIVNESNRRYYEPGAGRTFTAGIDLRWR
jgi:iron complex outermembrane receptor protein